MLNSCFLYLEIPNSRRDKLYPRSVVQIARFNTTRFVVMYGWYTWGGNRPVCGWYLQKEDNPCEIKPLQLTDLYDIYILEAAVPPPPNDLSWEQM